MSQHLQRIQETFKPGKKIGLGIPIDQIYLEQKQTIEGIRTIEALEQLSKQNGLELPLIHVAYEIISGKLLVTDAVSKLLSRDLKSEDF